HADGRHALAGRYDRERGHRRRVLRRSRAVGARVHHRGAARRPLLGTDAVTNARSLFAAGNRRADHRHRLLHDDRATLRDDGDRPGRPSHSSTSLPNVTGSVVSDAPRPTARQASKTFCTAGKSAWVWGCPRRVQPATNSNTGASWRWSARWMAARMLRRLASG